MNNCAFNLKEYKKNYAKKHTRFGSATKQRTTLYLDRKVVEDSKIHCVKTKQSLSTLVTELLRKAMLEATLG